MRKSSDRRINSNIVVALMLAAWLGVCSGEVLAIGPSPSEHTLRIKKSLAEARTALAEDRLTIPSGNNAVAYAQQVLDLAPGDPEAQKILEWVVARYQALGENTLTRAQSEMQRALGRAETYQHRAEGVAKRFQLPERSLEPLDRRMVAVKEELQSPVLHRAVRDMVDRYVQLSETALAQGVVEEARLDLAEAQEVAAKYGISDPQMQALAGRIEAEAPLASDRRSHEMLSHPMTRQLLNELVATHVATGELAIRRGAMQEAHWHYERARELVAQHHMPDGVVRGLQERLLVVTLKTRLPVYRLYGTF